MTTQEQIQGNWKQLSGKIKERWGALTDQDLKQVEGNFTQLVGLVQKKTGEAKSEVERVLNELSEQGDGMMRQASEAVRETAKQVKDRAQETYSGAEQMVRRHPAEAVAVAFGTGLIAGIVVGLLTRSR